MEDVFPYKENVNYENLQMTPEAIYSITRRRDSERIIQYLKEIIPNIEHKTITDGTACIGGDTIQFAMTFQKVHTVEWKHDNFIVLQNNVHTYGLQNVIFHEGDVTKLFNWKTDVLYIDPPWGGPAYHTLSALDLYLGYNRLDNWLEHMLKSNIYPSYIVLKLPRNYRFSRLQFLPNIASQHVYRIRGFIIVILVTC